MVLQDRQPPKADAPAGGTGGTVTLQCVASLAGTMLGQTLGPSLAAKLAASVLGALIGAFLTAPGRHRRRRIVAIALLLALLDALRRAGRALAAERRQEPRAWVPANWAVVGVTAVAGFVGGSAVTTVRGAWADDKAAIVSVPQVRGEPRARAVALLEDAGLRAGTATEPSESVAAGSATRTEPPAGTRVEEDSELTLFLSSGPPAPTVKVPDVTGLERSAARAVLADGGLRPRLRTEPSRSIARDHATRTDPPAGERVRRGAAVILLVSSGPPAQPVTIPDVRGQSRAAALARLRDAGLRTRTSREQSEDVAAGSATRTDPPAGTEVDRGSTVTLFVSSGRPAARIEVPDVTGTTREAAFAALEGAGLRPQGVEEASETVAEGTVVRTDPVAGTLVDAGSAVTVVVSSGPPPLLVPEVAGLGSAAASDRLRALGLTPKPSYEDDDAAYDTVIGTDPVAGTEVQRGDIVTLRISCGDNGCVE